MLKALSGRERRAAKKKLARSVREREIFEKAISLFRNGRLKDALRLFRQVVKLEGALATKAQWHVDRIRGYVRRSKARRTAHSSSKGKKLYAVRNASGKFKDIQTYERAHRADLASVKMPARSKKKGGGVGGKRRSTVPAVRNAELGRGGRGKGTRAFPRFVESLLAPLTRAKSRVQRMPHIDILPKPPVKPESRFDVLVYADAGAARPGEKAEAIEITLPPGVESVPISVRLAVTDHFRIVSEPIQELVIEREEPRTTTAHYQVRARTLPELAAVPGTPTISAYFTFRGRPSGKVLRGVRIAGFTPHRIAPRRAPWRGPALPGPALDVDMSAVQPDLTVEILDPHKDGQHFECTVRSPHLERFASGRAGAWDLPRQAGELVQGYFAKVTSDPKFARKTMMTLTGAGLELFDAAPEVFKEAFWALVDQRKALRTIQIVSQEPFIPWELMVPNRPRQDGPREERGQPLGVEFAVGRWIKEDFRSPTQRLPLTDGKAIAPNYRRGEELKHAAAELSFLRKQFEVQTIVPATVEGIERGLPSGGVSFLHFVCHGEAGDDPEVGMAIVLEGDNESLDATTLRGMQRAKAAFQAKPSFVFMNACEVGRQKPALTGVGGLAPTFLLIGAGAVLAPLWSVKDTIAFEFAKEFYRATKDSPGTAFAEILRAMRARAYRSPYEDSWAAYSFFGDPLAAQSDGSSKASALGFVRCYRSPRSALF